MNKWIELMRTGKWRDSTGREHEFTQARLEKIAAQYAERRHDAPGVVGHPETNSPAWCWIKELRVAGDRLLGYMTDIVPEFADALRRRMYKHISIALNPDDTLRHVGFLGGVPPAVKGLAPVLGFTAAPAAVIEFADSDLAFSGEDLWARGKLEVLGEMLRRIKNYLIEWGGAESAENALPEWQLAAMTTPPRPPEPAANPAFAGGDNTKEVSMAMINDGKSPADEVARLQAELAERDRRDREKAVVEFCQQLKTGGRLLPKHEGTVREILVGLAGMPAQVEFAAADGTVGKRTLYDAARAMFAEWPVVVPTATAAAGKKIDGGQGQAGAEFADVEVDADRLDLHRQCRALMAKEKIPYNEALARVRMQGGE